MSLRTRTATLYRYQCDYPGCRATTPEQPTLAELDAWCETAEWAVRHRRVDCPVHAAQEELIHA